MGLLGGYAETPEEAAAIEARDRAYYEAHEAAEACELMSARIEQLEIALRAALSFIQERHADHSDARARMVITAVRGALRKDRD